MTQEFNNAMDVRMTMFEKYLNRTNMAHNKYQRDGVRWILTNELKKNPVCKVRGGFIADEMGLGKTILMIGTLLCNFQKNSLIVVPLVLIDQWYSQIYTTTGHKPLIYHGNDKKTITVEALRNASIVITTYGAITLTKKQIINNEVTVLHKMNWSRIIYDEAHHLRNNATTRYTSAKMLTTKICWLVSGTPVQNRKQDFYSLCEMVKIPASFYTDPTNLKLLASSFILKRTKIQAGIHMTNVVATTHIVKWQNRKEMELTEEIHSSLAFSNVSLSKNGNLCNMLTMNSANASALPLMLRARQSCIYPKLMANHLEHLVKTGVITDYLAYKEGLGYSSKLDYVVNAILSNKGNGCGKLIFCHFREEIDEIANRLRVKGMANVATFDGRTVASKRSDILSRKNEALILQIQTGCEGLNLQEHYSEIYFISPHWNPAVEDQAVARCHRIGQTKAVYVRRFEMCNFENGDQEMDTRTIDNYVMSIQNNKRTIANECIEVE
jgi:SNF2 family DNA or RNA helicase